MTSYDERDLRAATAALMERGEVSDQPRVPERRWPDPIKPEGLSGLVGEIVDSVSPHSEADIAAIALQFLIAFGNAVGRGPHYRVGADEHHPNLFLVLVGQSAKGRKGSSWSAVQKLLGEADPEWQQNRTTSGMSSGEGLIWGVRDPLEKQEPTRDRDKKVTGYQRVIEDPGVEDKRLMVIEPEFASSLRVAERDGSTLSALVRQAWDSGVLRTLTKSPLKATGAHISIAAHITEDELHRELSKTNSTNGYANRFMWACVKRSKLLPDGGRFDMNQNGRLINKIGDRLAEARKIGQMSRDEDARDLWHDVYPQLSAERSGLLGAVTARAEAITLRLSCIFALMDSSPVIRMQHLAAALEIWRYCDDSARFIFGDALGDVVADRILAALRQNRLGMTRSEISQMFERNRSADQIERGLSLLKSHNLARLEKEKGVGRPVERWFATE